MKRKVIQIADSTQLVSLPRKWALLHGIKKGDEVDIREEGGRLLITTEDSFSPSRVEINTEGLGIMISRYIHALYKKGVDEIYITYKTQADMQAIQNALGKEAVGFEITNQGNNFCEIKHVSGELEDFDPILKRTFLLLLSMSEQLVDALNNNNYSMLPNIAFLEEANNRFTTTCRRLLNKGGTTPYSPIGPVYYILEDVENLADQYKYLCNQLHDLWKKNKLGRGLGKESIKSLEKTDMTLREFFDFFYKFDKNKFVDIAKKRKELINDLFQIIEKSDKYADRLTAHYLLVITQKIFCLTGPCVVINV